MVVGWANCLNEIAPTARTKSSQLPEWMIVTAVGEFAYTRQEDGIIVCPLSALN